MCSVPLKLFTVTLCADRTPCQLKTVLVSFNRLGSCNDTVQVAVKVKDDTVELEHTRNGGWRRLSSGCSTGVFRRATCRVDFRSVHDLVGCCPGAGNLERLEVFEDDITVTNIAMP